MLISLVLIFEGQAMPYWNEFKSDVDTPKNRRLLLITQPSGAPDGQEMDIHDVVVGHWSSPVWAFVIANVPNETASGAKLNVRYWAELPPLPPVKMRDPF
jgi:hypothetical protein